MILNGYLISLHRCLIGMSCRQYLLLLSNIESKGESMAGISAQEITDEYVYIKHTNGKEIKISKLDITLRYSTATGSNKKGETTDWVKQQIVDAIGSENVSLTELGIDFDARNGKPTTLQIINE